MENQKEIGDLEAREPSEFLGQKGPILADGNKTRPSSKGNGKPKGFVSGNRSIFSPGTRASGSENLEDEIKAINPSSCASEDSNSQSISELLAGGSLILDGTEMVEILGPTAEPLTKRPFPPVDRKSNKKAGIKNMDTDMMELDNDQEKIKGIGESKLLRDKAGRIGGEGKLAANPDQNLKSAKLTMAIRLASEEKMAAAGRSGNEPMRSGLTMAHDPGRTGLLSLKSDTGEEVTVKEKLGEGLGTDSKSIPDCWKWLWAGGNRMWPSL